MATTKMPIWIRSEYVTIVSPPFLTIRGQRSAPCHEGEHTACRLSAAPLQLGYHNRRKMTRPLPPVWEAGAYICFYYLKR